MVQDTRDIDLLTCRATIVFIFRRQITRDDRAPESVQPRRSIQYILVGCGLFSAFSLGFGLYVSIHGLDDWSFNPLPTLLALFLSHATVMLASVQSVPQVVTTVRLRQAGGINMLSLGLQVPVLLAMAWSLALRYGYESRWSIWMVFVIMTAQTVAVLTTCLLYEHWWPKDSNGESENGGRVAPGVEDDGNTGDDEETPLLEE